MEIERFLHEYTQGIFLEILFVLNFSFKMLTTFIFTDFFPIDNTEMNSCVFIDPILSSSNIVSDAPQNNSKRSSKDNGININLKELAEMVCLKICCVFFYYKL